MENVHFIEMELRLDGNHLCFNFINTIFDRYAEETRDLITSSEDWIAWLKRVNLINDGMNITGDIAIDLSQIIKVRELLYRIFYAILQKKTVSNKDLRQFEKLLLKTQKVTKLSVVNGEPSLNIELNNKNLNDYLMPIIRSAQELLMSGQVNRIKECSHCGWLYMDTSRNNSRKWCSMDTCGSQLKAKRYYKNKKAKTTPND